VTVPIQLLGANSRFLTFLASGEPLGLQVGVDQVVVVGLGDDLEQILLPDKTFGLPRNNLVFRDSDGFVPIVPVFGTCVSTERGGGSKLLSFVEEALTA
jgi:hypothetical protein